jgi:HAD superfamily hydrolase (TIGR01509 family)
MPAKRPPLVIFDCDGVLVDSELIGARELAAALAEIGYPLTARQVMDRFTGIRMPSILAEVEAAIGRPLPSDFEQQIRARDFAAFEAELKPVAGVPEALATLADAGQPRCVASSGAPEKINFNLSLTGLLYFFGTHLFSAHQVKHGKPAPDLFLFAAAQMGFAPADCIVIEDSLAGVTGAAAAGMTVWGFCGASHCRAGDGERLREAGASVIFDRMADLPQMLDGRAH